MKNKIIITAGHAYVDIDVLVCAVAYAELLNLEALNAEVYLTGVWNATISNSILNWGISIKHEEPSLCDELTFVIVDTSNPAHFERFVELGQVVEIFDHHFGHEDDWFQRLGTKSHIEQVGACATLIWEQFRARGQINKITSLSANLLYTAIIANTLNLKACVTTPRDIHAVLELKKITNLPNNWIEQYYSEVTKGIINDPVTAIANDTKRLEINGKNYIIGQLELWDPQILIDNPKLLEICRQGLKIKCGEQNIPYLVTIASIKDGFNYFVTDSDEMRSFLTAEFNSQFSNNIFGISNKLWLRKDIIKKLYKKI
jgi:inorganic pyrophosphatase/exopolyphosphatase